jgi:F-type H+-transporting ATPase subunit delta
MSVAKAYAKALYEAASEGKGQSELSRICDELETQLQTFVKIVSSTKEARIALESPVTTSKEKAAVVDAISKKLEASQLFSRFVHLMASKERLGILAEVADVFTSVRLEAEGGVSGKVISAEPMTDSDVDSLAKAFTKKLGKRVEFQVSTEPSLLAGVKVVVNGVTYDGSLRSQLEQLRDRFVVGMTQ